MKNALSISILLSLIIIAVFGVFILENSMKNHGSCLASSLVGSACPVMNQIAMLFLHVSALQKFSVALPAINSGLNLLLIATMLFVVVPIIGFKIVLNKNQTARIIDSPRQNFLKQNLLSWLALFENSPSY